MQRNFPEPQYCRKYDALPESREALDSHRGNRALLIVWVAFLL
jgi:hypothetical protein